MSRAIMWFRRDLRLSDQPALAAALAGFDEVIPIFVWDERLVANPVGPRLAFLSGCVGELEASLGGLVQRTGNPAAVVTQMAAECDAPEVFCTEDFAPYGRRRDSSVGEALAAAGRRLTWVGSPYAVRPGTLATATGSPFQVFTPFSRAWRQEGWPTPAPAPSTGSLGAGSMSTGGLASDRPVIPPAGMDLPEPGEAGAHRCLDAFLDGPVDSYAAERDRPDRPGTSRLSPYLKVGAIHPRQILARLDPTKRDHQKFEAEICWREFYGDVLFNRPDSARQSYRPEWRDFEVDSGPDADARFEAWAYGRTGYPIVDAGMRQLLGEGWVHNRVRMIVASFLVKDLHLDWRRGAQWFIDHLIDGDLASNHLGWQWVAGSGTDAAPYFRIFNPISQGKKFDPAGDYVRRWVPELAGADPEWVHEPWKVESSLFGAAGDYPAPIVEHSAEREVALARYASLRQSRS